MSADALLRKASYWILVIAVAIFGTGYKTITEWKHPLPVLALSLFMISGILFFISGWIFSIGQAYRIHEQGDVEIIRQEMVNIKAGILRSNEEKSKINQNDDPI